MSTMAADLIGEKLGRKFQALDRNNDGYLEWEDCQLLIDRYHQVFDLGKDDTRGASLQAFLQMYWQELLRHSGAKNQRLSQEEFVQASRLASVDTSRVNIVDGSAHAIFDCVDANGDNQITKDEFAHYLKEVWQLTAPDALDTFTVLDADGDGVISRQEFVRATREYFFSADSNAAGSLFFGRI
ncbi:EF-hand domain-containing protein [Streptomyces coffeae]|uniref:EF-hand domain-containing protein n=1 Tax=Streptomyces coffeae TaxID=621382 RepID=A0ABS1N8T1_9ACTN|nr:EF-hand domain-containing protein [Streptomyces coffeae]MBL1096367.1 EF-hand domain-containing protein [Streptomyces coffeae]